MSSTPKIDLIDRKLIAELDKNCRISNTQLAKKLRKSREVVAYRVQKLEERGIITGFITSINPTKFGQFMFKVYLKLENLPSERERFYAVLEQNKDIYWLGICDGAYDCVFAILSKSILKYYETINNLLSEWRHLILQKVLGTMVDTKQLAKRFLINTEERSYVTFGSDVEHYNLDTLDLEILNILVNNARIPLLELARQLHSTIEIVRRRMNLLEQHKIILQYRIAVDLNKLGLEFFKAIIYCKALSRNDEASLLEWMGQQPQSLYYIRALAPWELEFEFAVENYQEFNRIIANLRELFPSIIRNHEHLIMIKEMWMPGYKELIKVKS